VNKLQQLADAFSNALYSVGGLDVEFPKSADDIPCPYTEDQKFWCGNCKEVVRPTVGISFSMPSVPVSKWNTERCPECDSKVTEMAELEPKKPDPKQEWFCVRCAAKTEVKSGGRVEPGLDLRTRQMVLIPQNRQCKNCSAATVPYNIEELARLLKVQNELLEEAKAIDELSRRRLQEIQTLKDTVSTLKADRDRYAQPKFYHPDTGRILYRDQTAMGPDGHRVRVGFEGRCFEIDETGLIDAKGYIWRKAQADQDGGLRAEVEQLRRKCAELQAMVAQGGGTTVPQNRSRRRLNP
jgi:hypothetical protein